MHALKYACESNRTHRNLYARDLPRASRATQIASLSRGGDRRSGPSAARAPANSNKQHSQIDSPLSLFFCLFCTRVCSPLLSTVPLEMCAAPLEMPWRLAYKHNNKNKASTLALFCETVAASRGDGLLLRRAPRRHLRQLVGAELGSDRRSDQLLQLGLGPVRGGDRRVEVDLHVGRLLDRQ